MKVIEVAATSINITVYIKWRILGKHRDLRNTHRPSHMTERVILTLCWDWNAFLSHGFVELCLVLLFYFILFYFIFVPPGEYVHLYGSLTQVCYRRQLQSSSPQSYELFKSVRWHLRCLMCNYYFVVCMQNEFCIIFLFCFCYLQCCYNYNEFKTLFTAVIASLCNI